MVNLMVMALMVVGADFQKQLEIAGENRLEIEQAIAGVPEDQTRGMEWLLTHMPEDDLKTLSGKFLLENCDLAYEAWNSAPWKEQITEEVFFDCILPYANVNERRDDWRGDFQKRFSDIVAQATTPTEATILLNKKMFALIDVHYSTKRPKADQSPFESIEAGMASCTGLSILLVDACRSVGVPARFAGTPLWYNESGNHSWVEFWDNGWHYTGGAEPTGNKVDVSWFDDSASKATKGHAKHAIFAVTWEESDKHFPLIWLPEVTTYGAIDVTDRYAEEKESVLIPIRVRAMNNLGERQRVPVVVLNAKGEIFLEGSTKDDSADANDHLTYMLPKGEIFFIQSKNDVVEILIDSESIIDLGIDSLTQRAAEYHASVLWEQKEAIVKGNVIEYDGMKMPFWYTTYGDASFGEKPLWISMHGGGGAPAEVNTQQWENQKHLYTPKEGIYVAPRAPTDTWNLWHQSHIDPMFEKLITYMVKKEGVDPNKVYIVGYSAGGDGVYQLAARMADRLAGAGMMAGHPNETVPDGLRNIAFALHVGGEDAAYDRNKIAVEWKEKLAVLQSGDPKGYAHQAVVHEGKGHWMDKEEAGALEWLAEFERNPYPRKVVWVQDDVLHNQFYWLGVREPKARAKIVASISGQTITVHASDVDEIIIYLNDAMLDLDEPIIFIFKDRKLETLRAVRSEDVIRKTLRDPKEYYTAELIIGLP
jgi:poly(3-hydroxybutyrate) depolymerase